MNHAQLKKDVCRLLRITEAHYAQQQYQGGLDYLALYLHGLPQDARELEGNRIYWNWWKNHWAMRDQAWLQQCRQQRGAATLYSLWLHAHDAAMLAAEIRPSAMVLGKSYAGMIGKVIKAEVAK